MSLVWKLKEMVWKQHGRREAKRVRVDLTRILEQRGNLPEHHYQVAVHFADTPINLYQMRQWYGPLREINKTHPVILITRKPASALTLIEESKLDVTYLAALTDIERLLSTQEIGVILYVNHNTQNFNTMRFTSPHHIFINHGESDKAYMVTNQLKAYDFALVAGSAAQERLAQALRRYNVEERTIAIGRPQVDYLEGHPPYPADDRITVLYAPTWEGDRPAVEYGSLITHGESLVKRLLETGRHRVIYRPHPRTGVFNFSQRLANRSIKRMLAAANRNDPLALHVFDDSPSIGWQLSDTDVAICDISAMVYDRLATGKPLLVTRPTSPDAVVDEGGYLSVCEWLHAADAASIDSIIDDLLENEEVGAKLQQWSEHYFGDTSPGAQSARFHSAIERLLTKA